jgi:hypothetical protein
LARFSLYSLPFYHFSTGIKGTKTKLETDTPSLTKKEVVGLEDFKQRVAGEFPSVYQITKIAAILTAGNPLNHTEPMRVANQAIELWTACEGMRRAKINQLAQMRFFAKKEISDLIKQGAKIKVIAPIEVPSPKKFPVTFDEFLRLTIGGRLRSHRLKIYRDYARDMIWSRHYRDLAYPKNPANKISPEEAEKLAAPASFDEIANYVDDTARVIYKQDEHYQLAARSFLEWRAKQPSERGRKAAEKRWGKK